MNLISWNVRGLIAPSKHIIPKKIITQEKSDVVLIQETKCDKMTMVKIAKKIWENCAVEVVELEGASGRILFCGT
jgi:exonuclease III